MAAPAAGWDVSEHPSHGLRNSAGLTDCNVMNASKLAIYGDRSYTLTSDGSAEREKQDPVAMAPRPGPPSARST